MGCGWVVDGLWMGCGWVVDGLWMGCGWVVDGLWMGCGWVVDGLWRGEREKREMVHKEIHRRCWWCGEINLGMCNLPPTMNRAEVRVSGYGEDYWLASCSHIEIQVDDAWVSCDRLRAPEWAAGRRGRGGNRWGGVLGGARMKG